MAYYLMKMSGGLESAVVIEADRPIDACERAEELPLAYGSPHEEEWPPAIESPLGQRHPFFSTAYFEEAEAARERRG